MEIRARHGDAYFDEVREGFYVPGLVQRYWQCQIRILEELDKLCRRHGIRWFALFGTLLGAARHGGFIPWDDDSDIGMLYEDYQKLLAIPEEEFPEELMLTTYEENGKQDFQFIASFGLKRSPLEEGCMEKYCGVPFRNAVDIFVLNERLPEAEEAERERRIKLAYNLCLGAMQAPPDSEKRAENFGLLEKLAGKTRRPGQSLQDFAARFILREFALAEGRGIGDVGNFRRAFYGGKISFFPKAWAEELTELPFEDVTLPVPKEYGEVLRRNYGDWQRIWRGGGQHGYPVYYREKKALPAFFRSDWEFQYRFRKEDLIRAESHTAAEWAETLTVYLRSLHEELRKQTEQAAWQTILGECQSRALQLGELLEVNYLSVPEEIAALTAYCEEVFHAYRAETAEGMLARLPGMEAQLSAFERAYAGKQKKTILLMPTRYENSEGLLRLLLRFLETARYEISVLARPYYSWQDDNVHMRTYDDAPRFREALGRAIRQHFGSDRADCVRFLETETFQNGLYLPDAILIDMPYDDCSYTMGIREGYRSVDLQKKTKKLLYLPWFVTEDIVFSNPRDIPAVMNMEHYVCMPTLSYADHVLLQSEAVRETYLQVLCDFTGEENRGYFSEKLAAVGSPLYDGTEQEENGGSRAVADWIGRVLFLA